MADLVNDIVVARLQPGAHGVAFATADNLGNHAVDHDELIMVVHQAADIVAGVNHDRAVDALFQRRDRHLGARVEVDLAVVSERAVADQTRAPAHLEADVRAIRRCHTTLIGLLPQLGDDIGVFKHLVQINFQQRGDAIIFDAFDHAGKMARPVAARFLHGWRAYNAAAEREHILAVQDGVGDHRTRVADCAFFVPVLNNQGGFRAGANARRKQRLCQVAIVLGVGDDQEGLAHPRIDQTIDGYIGKLIPE